MKPIVLFLLLLSLIPCNAQTPENLTDVPQMALPGEADSWVVEIFSSGGLTGRSSRDFALSSLGKIFCDAPKQDCPKSFRPKTLQPLFKNVPIAGQFLPDPNVPTLCSDCITRTMIIRRRDAGGPEQTYAVSWNVVTAGTIPPDVMRLYEAVMSIRNP